MKTLLLLLLVLGSLSLVSFEASAQASNSANSASEALTLAKWKTLSRAEKIEQLDDTGVTERSVTFAELKNEALLAEVKKQADAALYELGTDNIDSDLDGMDSICTIGEPELVDDLTVYEVEGQIVAIGLFFVQSGGEGEGGEAPPSKHYDTAEEAEADGIDTGADVSWQANSLLEVDGAAVTMLEVDVQGEGGFRWSGW